MLTVLISFALTLMLALPAAGDDKQAPESTKVDTAALKSAPPESLKTGEELKPGKSYDDFVDENKNGINDKYEKTERKKVKCQRIKLRSKPNKVDTPEKR